MDCFPTINSARGGTRHGAAMLQSATTELFTRKIEQKYREKEKRHQRHNLTVLSQLPVARSGAVG
jgi:hypothetical protein